MDLLTDHRPADGRSVAYPDAPGLTMLITDEPAPDASRSVRGFVIATHNEPNGWRTRTQRN